jgi:hypothetical protein
MAKVRLRDELDGFIIDLRVSRGCEPDSYVVDKEQFLKEVKDYFITHGITCESEQANDDKDLTILNLLSVIENLTEVIGRMTDL